MSSRPPPHRRSQDGGSSGPGDLAAQAGDDPAADERYERDVERDAGFEAHRRAGGDVEAETARRGPVEGSAGLASAKW